MSAPAGPARPRLRALVEDFRVDEIPLYPPSGEGEHLFVRVEKRGVGSDEVARRMARAAGVRPRDVGYAGRKDRHAVARQWFSVPGLAPEAVRCLESDGLRVLEAARHRHKLRTGHLRANRFELCVRGVTDALAARAEARLREVERAGFPNRFGAQRFGREGDNASRGLALLRGERGPRDRRAARFWLSALQSQVFNAVLAARELAVDRLEVGDVAVVDASGGLFRVEDLEQEAPRAASFEISPTGPIFGTRVLEPDGDPLRREAEALRAEGVPDPSDWQLPRGLSLPGARRSLRARVSDASLSHAGTELRLAFELRRGSFATVLVEELLGPVEDAARDAAGAPSPPPLG